MQISLRLYTVSLADQDLSWRLAEANPMVIQNICFNEKFENKIYIQGW